MIARHPPSHLIANSPPSGQCGSCGSYSHKCGYCLDHGVVSLEGTEVVMSEPGVAPCPNCAKGWRLERGIGSRTKKNRQGQPIFDENGEAVLEEYATRPYWGKDGFWRGRPTEVRRASECSGSVTPRAWTEVRDEMRVYAQEHGYEHGFATIDSFFAERELRKEASHAV